MPDSQDEPKAKKNWPGAHVFELDLRSLALGRICLGLVLITDILIRWWDATVFYSDYGVFPRDTLLKAGWNKYFISLHMASGEPWWAWLLFACQFGLAICLVLGFRTRVATALSWALLISVHNRNHWILNGGDVYLRCILFWTIFLPWGQVWSLDAKKNRSDYRWWVNNSSRPNLNTRSLACVGVILQVCLLYWFAAIPKTHPSWVADYSAIDIALRLDHLVAPFGVWFRETFASYLGTLTYLVYEWETWGPFLLLFPFDRGQIRTLAIAGFVALHIGFGACFEIGIFPHVCAVVPLLLLPSWWWDGPFSRITKFLNQKLPTQEVQTPTLGRAQVWLRHLTESFFLFVTLYVFLWNFSNEPVSPSIWVPGPVTSFAYTTRLDQRWNMFSPSPPYQDGWWVIVGKRLNGELVNVLEPQKPISWEKPKVVAQTYLNQRRRRWMMELRSSNNSHLLASTCSYLMRQVNPKRQSIHGVYEIKLYFMVQTIHPDGSKSEPEKLELYRFPEPKQESGQTGEQATQSGGVPQSVQQNARPQRPSLEINRAKNQSQNR